MKRRFNPSAAQLALLTALGGVIIACGCLPLISTHHHNHRSTILVRFAISLALFALGFAIAYQSSSSLEQGLIDERWPADKVETLRATLQSRLLTALSLTLLLGGLLFFFTRHYSELYWATYILCHTILQLQRITKPPRPQRPLPIWSNLAPIRSEHWGER